MFICPDNPSRFGKMLNRYQKNILNGKVAAIFPDNNRKAVITNEANLIGGENVGGATAATGADVTVAAKDDDDSGDPDPDPDRHKSRPAKPRTKSKPAPLPEEGYVRLPQVLAVIPVSKSTWWAGCKSGRYPAPVKLGPRTTAWPVAAIRSLIATFSA